MRTLARSLAAVAALSLSLPAPGTEVTKTQGVFVTLFADLKTPLVETAVKAEEALKANGFTVLASTENGVPEGCRARSRTLVFAKEAWAAEVLAGGPDKAFGLPLRLSFFEAGVSVALANPGVMERPSRS